MIWIVGMVLVVFFAGLGNVLTMREGPVGEVPNKMSQARSNRRTVTVSMRWEMPSMARCSSRNRHGPLDSSTMTSTDHLSPSRSRMSRMPQSW